jgi:integrase
MAKIAAGTHNGDTANKQLERVRDILQTVARSEEIDLDYKQMFAELKFQPKRSQRASYDPAFVQDRILAPGALDGLNEDARLLVIAMACTGAREGELVGLRAEDIVLDVKVPYIHIRPYDGHLLKTAQSERQIPLVGPALKSFKNKPEGITRYEQADSVCAVVNKYLTRHSLRPTEKHSLYSLRHCFKDRLRDAGAPEEIIDELMGHEGHRPKYGRGHLLESKLKWMKKIAFR